MITDIVMDEVNERDEEDEREVDVQAKSLEEQSGQIFNVILIFHYNCINLFICSIDRYYYG
jgi:hypothetical protein